MGEQVHYLEVVITCDSCSSVLPQHLRQGLLPLMAHHVPLTMVELASSSPATNHHALVRLLAWTPGFPSNFCQMLSSAASLHAYF